MVFKDRREAGRKLAKALGHYQQREDVRVVALPRGGVAVAHEVAKALEVPLEVFITRKIGVPGDPELAAGAVAETGDIFVDQEKVDYFGIHPLYLEREISRRIQEIIQLQKTCRQGRPRMDLKDHVAVVVDDGIATGATILTTLKAIQKEGVKKLVLAVPVAPLDMIDDLKKAADEVVVLAKPFPFTAVGAAYEQFDQLSDEEMVTYLQSPLVGAGRG